nr:hypothetical protein [Tanacetum cinerariifolium]
MVIGGQRWRSTTVKAADHRSTTVAGGEPPLTAVGPPLTTTGPPVNGGWWAGQQAGLGRSGSGLGRVRVGSGSGLGRPPPTQYLVHQSLAASRRYVAASYWTAASDVAATSAPVNAANHRRSKPLATDGQRRRPPVNGGGQRRSPVANHH